jgi:hypothetical protein
VYTADILEIILPLAVPPFRALLLYGSYARGEQDESSDLDILQLTTTHTSSYSRGKVNFTCYTRDQLFTLAINGALFARHLALEGVSLFDPNGILTELKAAYVAPVNYSRIQDEVIQAIPLVAIRKHEFVEHPYQYCSTASYLLRTFVYARAFQQGAESFSMKHISSVNGDNRPRQRLVELRECKDYSRFRSVVDLLFELADTPFFIRQESLEALVLNMFGVCDLAVILGLRILAHGELISYPVVRSQA